MLGDNTGGGVVIPGPIRYQFVWGWISTEFPYIHI
jgi:hypothetical protein